MISVGHLALYVPNLRQAESFYQKLFNMELLMREAPLEDGPWYTLPFDKGWDDAEAAGIKIKMVALKREDFVLPLFEGRPVPRETVLEIGVVMPVEEIAATRDRWPESVALVEHPLDTMFRDPFGYTWHLWPEGEVFQSNGESRGRWLEVP
jgi:catechol 2,3-dioxygenase-like lactoylglutathione lyase family enzyme